jgi:pimeloyl-ACP methyl ester carboxylesterase
MGKSYSDSIDPSTLNMRQYVADAEELVNSLRSQFHVDKIYVAGHSWGTVIGTQLAQEHPEQLYAYIGVGQVVDLFEGMDMSYQWALDTAKRTGNQAAIKELEVQGQPVASEPDVLNERWNALLKWIAAFGGSQYHEETDAFNQAMIETVLREAGPKLR